MHHSINQHYQLRQILMAQAHVSGYIAPYDTVINETNALANTYNNILARRSGNATALFFMPLLFNKVQ